MSTVFKSHAPRGVGNPSALSLSLRLWEMVTKQNNTWTEKWRAFFERLLQKPCPNFYTNWHGRATRERLYTCGSRQGIYRAVEEEVKREQDGTESNCVPFFLKRALRFGAFSPMECINTQRPEGTDRPAEARPSWSEGQTHVLLSLPLGSRLTLDILVPQQGLALLI